VKSSIQVYAQHTVQLTQWFTLTSNLT